MKNCEKHPTSQQIYFQQKRDFPSSSLATVYNTLDALVQAGLIKGPGNAGNGMVQNDAESEPLSI